MQRLEHFDVEVVRERGVAADAEHADGALHRVECLDGLEDRPHRDRLTATGAEVVLADVEQCRREVVDQTCGYIGWSLGRDVAVSGHSAPPSQESLDSFP